MQWIPDASATIAWCFEGERTTQTERWLTRIEQSVPAIVPQIWPIEVANVLALATRRKRLNPGKRTQFVSMLEKATITVDVLPLRSVLSGTILLADKFNLTAYDASYLELAIRLNIPLATLDASLRTAAARAGVELL